MGGWMLGMSSTQALAIHYILLDYVSPAHAENLIFVLCQIVILHVKDYDLSCSFYVQLQVTFFSFELFHIAQLCITIFFFNIYT